MQRSGYQRLGQVLVHPMLLAAILTLANACKDVVVDDTAYLLIARHIAPHPLDPYGHKLFWYERPEPAMEILAPPVLPYWLAFGIRIFGENVLLLKLWLFPFAWLLAAAGRALLRRCLHSDWPLPVLVLGPGVLPLFNFMLDVPALALELSAIAIALRAMDRGASRRWILAAGVVGGLALQTKYSTLMLPNILLLIGWRSRQFVRAVAIVVCLLLAFAIIEWVCCHARGQSHFLFHLARSAQTNGATLWERIVERLTDCCGLANPLLAHLGVLSAPVALLALVFVGLPRRWVFALTAVATLGWQLVLWLPGQQSVIVPGPHPSRDRTTIATVVFVTIGSFATMAGVWAAFAGAFRKIGTRRRSAMGEILLGWLMLEVIGYFVLTPFPAARRLIGVSWIGTLIAFRLAPRWWRAWLIGLGLTISGVVMVIDCWDATVEPWVAKQAVAIGRANASGRGYGVGHWSFQYALDREGVALIVPGETKLRANDWLVLPIDPDDVGFYRPYHGGANIRFISEAVELLGEVRWDDCLAAQTIPTLYGGKVPIVARKHPRLVVRVYRVVADKWIPQTP